MNEKSEERKNCSCSTCYAHPKKVSEDLSSHCPNIDLSFSVVLSKHISMYHVYDLFDSSF